MIESNEHTIGMPNGQAIRWKWNNAKRRTLWVIAANWIIFVARQRKAKKYAHEKKNCSLCDIFHNDSHFCFPAVDYFLSRACKNEGLSFTQSSHRVSSPHPAGLRLKVSCFFSPVLGGSGSPLLYPLSTSYYLTKMQFLITIGRILRMSVVVVLFSYEF